MKDNYYTVNINYMVQVSQSLDFTTGVISVLNIKNEMIRMPVGFLVVHVIKLVFHGVSCLSGRLYVMYNYCVIARAYKLKSLVYTPLVIVSPCNGYVVSNR